MSIPFWIYRYPSDDSIQVIPQKSIDLLRLITASDATRCEIFNKQDFKENERVRITGGIYEGFEGYVQRVKKNKHVIVRIEGICLIMLPFIHPDLLEKNRLTHPYTHHNPLSRPSHLSPSHGAIG